MAAYDTAQDEAEEFVLPQATVEAADELVQVAREVLAADPVEGPAEPLLIAAMALDRFWWSLNATDETITFGSKWGIEIGQEKAATLEALRRALAEQKVAVGLGGAGLKGEPYAGELRQLPDSMILKMDRWNLGWKAEDYFELQLVFENDRLVKASRASYPTGKIQAIQVREDGIDRGMVRGPKPGCDPTKPVQAPGWRNKRTPTP